MTRGIPLLEVKDHANADNNTAFPKSADARRLEKRQLRILAIVASITLAGLLFSIAQSIQCVYTSYTRCLCSFKIEIPDDETCS